MIHVCGMSLHRAGDEDGQKERKVERNRGLEDETKVARSESVKNMRTHSFSERRGSWGREDIDRSS